MYTVINDIRMGSTIISLYKPAHAGVCDYILTKR